MYPINGLLKIQSSHIQRFLLWPVDFIDHLLAFVFLVWWFFNKLYHGKSSPSRPTIWENLFVGSLFPFGSWPVATSRKSLPTNCHSPAMTLPETTFLEEMPPNSDLWGGFFGWQKSCRWVGFFRVNLGSPGHFRKQEKTRMVPFAGSKCWWVSRVWWLDSGPNLQPCHGS